MKIREIEEEMDSMRKGVKKELETIEAKIAEIPQ
jgi:hypothetical protein